MPKYIQSGGKFFTVGDRNQLQQITEQDILGRRGDVPGGATLDLVRREGDIAQYTPQQLQSLVKPYSEWSGVQKGVYQLGDTGALLRNRAEFQALGLQYPTDVPETGALGSTIPFNQDFAQYLQETGQSFNQQTGFSGSATIPSTQATLAGQQAGTINPITGQPTQPGAVSGATGASQQPEGVYRDTQNNFYVIENGQRRKIELPEFKSLGINETFVKPDQVVSLAEAVGGPSARTQLPPELQALNQGIVTSGQLPQQQALQQQQIQGQVNQVDDLVGRITTLFDSTQLEKDVQKQIDLMNQQLETQGVSFEMGINEIMDQPIPQPLLVGQSESIQRQYLASERNTLRKISALQKQLDRLGDNREAQLRALTFALDAKRQSAMDSLNLFKALAPERVATDEQTGTIYFANLDGTITSKKLPGWTPPAIKGTGGGGVTPGAPTGSTSQFTAANYANRVEQSNNIFDVVSSDLSQLGTVEFGIQKRLPNALKSSTMRQYEQASRNFINAVLRRESGAAIAESEFTSAEKQYLPQPGDDQQTLLQKQLNRQLVQRNFINEAGTAYAPTSLTNPPSQQKQPPGTIIKSGNTLYQVGADGETLTAIGSAQ